MELVIPLYLPNQTTYYISSNNHIPTPQFLLTVYKSFFAPHLLPTLLLDVIFNIILWYNISKTVFFRFHVSLLPCNPSPHPCSFISHFRKTNSNFHYSFGIYYSIIYHNFVFGAFYLPCPSGNQLLKASFIDVYQ